MRHEREVDRRVALAAVGREVADEVQERDLVGGGADEAAADDVDVLAEAGRVGRDAEDLGLDDVDRQRQRAAERVGAGREDVAHGDAAAERGRGRCRRGSGENAGTQATARAIPRRDASGSGRARDLDAVDDDAGLAFAGAEEEAVAGEDDGVVDVELRAVGRRDRGERRARALGEVEVDAGRIRLAQGAVERGDRLGDGGALEAAAAASSVQAAPAATALACVSSSCVAASVSSTACALPPVGVKVPLQDEARGGARRIGEAGADEIESSTTAGRAPGAARRRVGAEAVVEPGELRGGAAGERARSSATRRRISWSSPA